MKVFLSLLFFSNVFLGADYLYMTDEEIASQIGNSMCEMYQSKEPDSFYETYVLKEGFFNGEPVSDINKECYSSSWTGGEIGKIALDFDANLCFIADFSRDIEAKIKADSKVVIHAGYKSIEAVSAEFVATSKMEGSPSISLNLMVMGYTVNQVHRKIPGKEVSFKLDGPVIDKTIPYATSIGPIPLTFTLGVVAKESVDVDADLDFVNMKVNIVPQAESSAYFFGGVDVWVLKGGLQAQVLLLDDDLDLHGTFGLNIDLIKSSLYYMYEANAYNDMEALRGDVKIIVESEVPIPDYGKKFEYPLFVWDGYKESRVLFEKKVGPKKIEIE